MKSLASLHASLSLLYVVYPKQPRASASDPGPFYVWGKRSLSFCKRPQGTAPRGH